MNSFRNQRIVIASLFLPSTAVVGTDSPIATPEIRSPSFSVPDVLQRVESAIKGPARPALRKGSNPPAKASLPTATPRPRPTQAVALLVPRPESELSIRDEWHVEHNPHCNGGLKNAIVSMGDKLKKKLWVGTVEPLRHAVDKKMLVEQACVPVWIPDAEFESCYDEFCHQVLGRVSTTPSPTRPKTKMFYESASFKQYVAVNQRFADTIAANYQDGDISTRPVLLLPALFTFFSLGKRLPPHAASRHAARVSANPRHAPIGFFMHVAFPSSEIFRCLSVRRNLLNGLLAANIIGFQTANYARHFRQTVSRIMAYEALPRGIQVSEGAGAGEVRRMRFVDVGVFPMGIDVQQLEEKNAREPDVAEWVQVLKQRYVGMKLVVGRDKLDEIQGAPQVARVPDLPRETSRFQQKVVLIQRRRGSIADIVTHINSRFSTLTYQPVVFLPTQDLTFSQYLALLTVADAFLVTSLREGMALRTHEFVDEFTDRTATAVRSCIAINPWDTRGTAAAINQALTMSDDEALGRWEDLHNHVTTQTGQAFVTTFLSRCLRSHTEQHLQSHEAAPMLDMHRVLPRYKHSSKRLLLMDLEGTCGRGRGPGLGHPCDTDGDAGLERALEVLRRFAADGRNDVWLLSGLPIAGVLSRIAKEVPRIGIVAENGGALGMHGGRRNGAELSPVNTVATLPFTERTPGSFVEEREASIVWRFWTGDWALRQAAEAQNHIFDSLGERYGLRIIPGDNSFLVLPNNVSRSTATILSRSAGWMSHDTDEDAAGDLDLVLAVSGDEKLIRRLNEFDTAETVATGGKATDAKWRLDADKVLETLGVFASVGV
ncbi:alpha,alpha-trehalose-phosphate synthase [Mycena olivaceomarginata]|nr:alpha,alpha-trehalose-phosphate synthase [Mycena olivaceomarginata]